MSQLNHGPAFGTERAPTKGWFERHKPLAIVLACLALPIFGCLFLGGVLAVATTALRSSGAYQVALTTAEHDPALVAELGAPMRPGWLMTGEVKVHGSDGEASLAIPISGPRGSGKLIVRASKSDGTWRCSQLQADIAGRSTPLDLLATR